MDDPFPGVEDDNSEAPEQERRDMETVMLTVAGRRLVWSILRDLTTFDAVIGERQAGRHEAGRELLLRAKRANLDAYRMMNEEHDV